MTIKDVLQFIEQNKVTYSPMAIQVTMSNGVTHLGFFHDVDDGKDLKEKFQYRFVTLNNSSEFKKFYEIDRAKARAYTAIIDANFVKHIQLVNAS